MSCPYLWYLLHLTYLFVAISELNTIRVLGWQSFSAETMGLGKKKTAPNLISADGHFYVPDSYWKTKAKSKPNPTAAVKGKLQWKSQEDWAENQKFGGDGAQMVRPQPLEDYEPELSFFGYVHPETFAPTNEAPNENELEPRCRDFRFDVRDKWPECTSLIGNIRDQAHCSSCYAVACASAFSDRHCIALAKKGKVTAENAKAFSAADVMDCSWAGPTGDACSGGYSSKVWKWLTEVGVVTGNGYNSGDGCKPYPIEPEKATTGDSGNQQFYYPIKCPQVCTNPAFSEDYFSDKVKALNYNVVGTLEENPSKKWPGPNPKKGGFSWEQTMKEELLKNGSITVDYLLYGDFFDYPTKLGIYEHIYGAFQYAHVVRLIGYGKVFCADGTEKKYWLAANSWGRWWGDNGLFRIARGVDECGIESRQIGFGTAPA